MAFQNPTSVCICTVTAGPPKHWEFMDGVLGLKATGEKMFHHIAGKQGVDDGHNRIIEWFLHDTAYEWMLSLDTDAAVHADTLIRLLSWNEPFVSALAFQRGQPYAPVVYTDPNPLHKAGFLLPVEEVCQWIGKHPELLKLNSPVVLDRRPDDALWKVSRGGAHCLLIHREVLNAIEPPWFVRSGKWASKGSGSDFDFYRRAIEVGFQPYVDMSVMAGHMIGELCIGALDFMVWNAAGEWNQADGTVGIDVILPEQSPATAPLIEASENEPICLPGNIRCSRCQECKPESEFHSNTSRLNGHDAYCKLCRAGATKAYRQRVRRRVESEIQVARRSLSIP